MHAQSRKFYKKKISELCTRRGVIYTQEREKERRFTYACSVQTR